MACHWEIFKCRQVFNCSRETFLLSRTRATGLKHSHHNLYCFILVKSLTTGGAQMCHSSGSWSEIQSPHQDLIYDQPVGKGQGNQGCTGSWGKLTELNSHTGGSPHCQQGISASEPQHQSSFELWAQQPGKHQDEIQGWLCSGQAQCKGQLQSLKGSGKSRAGIGRREWSVVLQSRNRSRLPALPWWHTEVFLTTPHAFHITPNPSCPFPSTPSTEPAPLHTSPFRVYSSHFCPLDFEFLGVRASCNWNHAPENILISSLHAYSSFL